MKPQSFKHISFLAVFMVYNAGNLFSQNIIQIKDPSVISVAGGYAIHPDLSLEWTLGETFVETIRTKTRIYSQGFHQPLLVSPAYASGAPKYEISVFPNPTEDLLNIYIKSLVANKLFIRVTDIAGKVLLNQTEAAGVNQIQLSLNHFAQGMYMLSMIDEEGYRLHSFKIIKQ